MIGRVCRLITSDGNVNYESSINEKLITGIAARHVTMYYIGSYIK